MNTRTMIPIYLGVWKLIARHDITHIHKVLNKRAMDIWEVVTNTKKESGDASLSWAADTSSQTNMRMHH